MTDLARRQRVLRCRVRDCRIDLASFAGAKFERVVLSDRPLGQSDFKSLLHDAVRALRPDRGRPDGSSTRNGRCAARPTGMRRAVAAPRRHAVAGASSARPIRSPPRSACACSRTSGSRQDGFGSRQQDAAQQCGRGRSRCRRRCSSNDHRPSRRCRRRASARVNRDRVQPELGLRRRRPRPAHGSRAGAVVDRAHQPPPALAGGCSSRKKLSVSSGSRSSASRNVPTARSRRCPAVPSPAIASAIARMLSPLNSSSSAR